MHCSCPATRPDGHRGRPESALLRRRVSSLAPHPSAANDLWRIVLNAEVNSFHWTLMHRFHKASDIINEVGLGVGLHLG